MEYIITKVRGNSETILSVHVDKKEAMIAGEREYEKSLHADVISCIYGNISDEGKITGKYTLIKTWL